MTYLPSIRFSRAKFVLGSYAKRERALATGIFPQLLNPIGQDQAAQLIRDDDWWTANATAKERRFVALVKALLISADVAGSTVPRSGESPERWTESAVAEACKADMLYVSRIMAEVGERLRQEEQELIRGCDGGEIHPQGGGERMHKGSEKRQSAMWAESELPRDATASVPEPPAPKSPSDPTSP